jgi:hypothetical protein
VQGADSNKRPQQPRKQHMDLPICPRISHCDEDAIRRPAVLAIVPRKLGQAQEQDRHKSSLAFVRLEGCCP